MIGVWEGGLYKLKGHLTQALVHKNISYSELWHWILSHLNYRALPILSKVVMGLPDMHVEHNGVCKGCALGKNANIIFTRNENRSKGILDIIHSVECRQMTIPYLGNFIYYVTFIEDFSHKTWIYFLKSKDEVFNKFQ
jgi:hypothetical protein